MTTRVFITTTLTAALLGAGLMAGATGLAAAQAPQSAAAGVTPRVGQTAHAFSLSSIDGQTVSLAEGLKQGPVVLVMLRGWPGYQCPFCTRQFGDYLRHADELKAAAGRVILVYPGPAEGLADFAKMFTEDQDMPANFSFLIDPDYTFTNLYGLRWNASGETSYPSTFVLDSNGTVTFANTSREHGGRVPVADVLKALAAVRR